MGDFEKFFASYLKCALRSSVDFDDTPLDKHYGVEDIAPNCLTQLKEECLTFWQDNYMMIEHEPERAGHDFWLTRNRHGAGFWDGDWPENEGHKLTKASNRYSEVDLYVGDDGMIYC